MSSRRLRSQAQEDEVLATPQRQKRGEAAPPEPEAPKKRGRPTKKKYGGKDQEGRGEVRLQRMS